MSLKSRFQRKAEELSMGAQNSKVVDTTTQVGSSETDSNEVSNNFRNPVVEYARKTAHIQDMTGTTMTRVFVIYCGGTIGMKKDPKHGYRPVKNFLSHYLKSSNRFHDAEYAEFLSKQSNTSFGIQSMDPALGEVLVLPISMYGKRVAYQIHEYKDLKDSCNVTSKDWIGFAKNIEEVYHKYDAFIIMHGTDTMAYTASALSFLLENLGKTVVITGSQIPFSELRNDAHENFLGALTIAGHYVIPEVTVFFDNKLLRGNRSRKVNAVDFEAFDSPNIKPLAKLGTSINIDWSKILRPNGLPFKAWTTMNDLVGCFRLFPGISADAIRALTAPPMRGIVLESFGTGNAPDDRPDLLAAIKEACDRGVVVVNVTQCTKGTAGQFYATGHAISAAGVVSGIDMTAECALTKLNYLLSHDDYDVATVKRMLMEPLHGELTVPAVQLQGEGDDKKSLLSGLMDVTLSACPDANREAVENMLRPLVLHQAAAEGDIQALREICSRGLHLNHVNQENRTCLFSAITGGHVSAVQWLVHKGTNVHMRDKYGQTPLIHAVKCLRTATVVEDMVNIVSFLALEAGSKLDDTSLVVEVMQYAQEGNVGMLEFLFTLGAYVMCVDCGGRNILHIAVANNRPEVIRWVRTKSRLRALFDMRDKFKRTALIEAEAMGPDGEEFVEILRAAKDESPIKKLNSMGSVRKILGSLE